LKASGVKLKEKIKSRPKSTKIAQLENMKVLRDLVYKIFL
jgi:hypothetical protein